MGNTNCFCNSTSVKSKVQVINPANFQTDQAADDFCRQSEIVGLVTHYKLMGHTQTHFILWSGEIDYRFVIPPRSGLYYVPKLG